MRIHAPSWTPRAEIECYVRQQHDWLHRAWIRMQARAPQALTESLAEVRYLGRALVLDIRASLFVEIQRHGDTLRVHAPLDAEIGTLVRAWLNASIPAFSLRAPPTGSASNHSTSATE